MNVSNSNKKTNYVFSCSLLALCILTIISIVVSSPPVIYTYKSAIFALTFSGVIVIVTIVEIKLRKIRGYYLKQAVISLFPSTLLILFSIPTFAWIEYNFSDFVMQTVVTVERKEIKYYRNSISCYELSLGNDFINGNLCASPNMYAESQLYSSIEITYKKSPFGYLIKI
ncbi:hypothetical protein PVK62_17155 [Aliivibrio sp. S3MY1]|uniref:hypothetical protein n=1 Tax=unclassified Aliivibrio TaxID=2645654 RepID=UPI0023792C1D|nr:MULTISPECIES: hypothetical protein [unclassified Aliivibrio]MDD9197551.1 hypothetical protein [Aliivibrio sp. S3MY1]MDD9200805.1 hypothetical protein [Aliivibrio sp. S2MY1]